MKKCVHGGIFLLAVLSQSVFGGVYDDYAGITKIYYFDDSNESNKTLINPFEKDKTLSRDINETDFYEIRLQNLQFNQTFEWLSKYFFKEKRQNEYAIFLTLEERNISDNNVSIKANRRLVYAADYGRRKDVPLNLSNKLIFRDKYSGGDIYFKLEVVEMDSDTIEKYRQIFEPLLSAAKTITNVASVVNSQYTQLLDAMGNALYQHLKKDDLILTYETEFLKYGTVENNGTVGQNYFSWGEYYLVRDSQNRTKVTPYIDTNSSNVIFTNENNKTETLSFAHISILKRK